MEASYTSIPDAFERCITPRTKAVMPCITAGRCDTHRINEIARAHNIVVIEDAAHAAGAALDGVRVGLSAFTPCSFSCDQEPDDR